MNGLGQFYPIVFGDKVVQIWRADCIHFMRCMDDDSVDHVFADPPYERHMHAAKSERRGRKMRQDGYVEFATVNFESVEDIRAEAAEQMVRVCRGWLIVFCTPEGVAPWRDAIEAAGGNYKRACHWIKPDAAPQFNGQGPAMGGEMFVTAWCGSGYAKWNAGGKRGVYTHLTNPPGRDRRHPTEKPVGLMREIAADFASAGDLVLDPFMGSGTTGVAALADGCRFAGIEKDPRWFAVAEQRLKWQHENTAPIHRQSDRRAGTDPDFGPLFSECARHDRRES